MAREWDPVREGNDIAVLLLNADDHESMPPSRVIDLGQAMADGARIRARRSVMTVGAVAGLTVLALSGGVMASGMLGRSGAAPAVQGTTSPTPSTPTAPAQFDVLSTRLAPGWLPPVFTERVQLLEATQQSLNLVHFAAPVDGESNADASMTITLYAAGVAPGRTAWLDGEAWPPTTPTGVAVNGQPSFAAATDHAEGRAWQWAPGAWATITARGPALGSRAELNSALDRVMTHLRTDVAAVRMPFTVPAPPAPLVLRSTMVAHYTGGRYEAQLVFSDRADRTDPRSHIPRLLIIGVQRDSTRSGDGKNGYPTTVIDGHPAVVDFTDESGTVQLLDVHGHRLTVNVYDPVTMGYVGKAEATALARAIALVQNPADELQWTDRPVR
jgi:hypothetical protein